MVRHPQFEAGMPSRPIEHQDDLLLRTGSRLAREFGEFDFKHRNADRRGQMKEGAPRGRMDKAHQIAPGEAVLDDGGRTLANRRLSSPDPPQERL